MRWVTKIMYMERKWKVTIPPNSAKQKNTSRILEEEELVECKAVIRRRSKQPDPPQQYKMGIPRDNSNFVDQGIIKATPGKIP